MIPYRKWKFLNESIFNRTLGITNHQSLGLISPFLTAQDGAQEVTSNQDGEENVLVDEKRSHGKKKKSETETCKYCGSKMKKEHMDEDEYEGDEGEREEDDEEEEGDESDDEGDEGDDEGDEGDDEGDEGDDEGDEGDDEGDESEDEGDMDESKKHKSKKGMKYMKDMKCMSCMGKDEDEGDMGDSKMHKSKKGMMHMKDMKESFKYNFMKGKKGKKGKKVDKKSEGSAADGSVDAMVKKLVKKGMPEKFAMVIAKKKAEKAKNESSWMNDIFGGDPNKKNYDGINEMVEQNPMVLKKSLQDAEFVAQKGDNTVLLSIINKIKPHVLAGEKIDQNLYDAIVDGNPNDILPAYQAASKSGKF